MCDNAFFGFLGFEEVTFPKSLKTVGDSAFHSCRNIKRVNYLGSAIDFAGVFVKSNNAAIANAMKVFLDDEQ